ncbi:molybdenum cofactor biosysynthesis protein [Pseudonocardia sp. EC080610-09]|uniref:MOSC domain-containing protein n=1 Tax=unclassified Pseudonocardia TaxID=2619320 RepID=UPI0006CB4F3C|nr:MULTISPECIES: MOSC N-terminal beta barrel domain-containing protein [unclassified Pseudonocardia]ALE75775.1 molybdenum cofactor biosysynthesis protein [Pseudonocardia sp. EC080625-04]ALL75153.1 molybdenum cofactor biosysynthesis protein [Pseudonocardia sp. EC080610-09]ALL82178.1 molybdenum cofactor biosysynthesis protein [Pseudonocardia sp. EC080619-01]
MVTLTGLRRYPVKSCRGADLRRAVVERAGLAGDRRWMLVSGDDGRMVTARTHPRLVLAVPQPVVDGLEITGPDLPALRVAVPDPSPGVEPVRVHRWETAGVRAGDDADAWFSELLGEKVRLVHLDDPDRRRPDPEFARDDDRVSFADGYPLLLTSTSSLDALNARVADGPHAGEGPLPMVRFRPNLVVSGAPAWAEDGWRRVRIGDARFRIVKGCARCVLTTVDPVTAVKGREPMVTLARHRRFDKGVWFGMNLVPDDPGTELHVGDPVEVLDAADPADGPPR